VSVGRAIGGGSTGRLAAWLALVAGAAVIAAFVLLVVRDWVTLLIALAALGVAAVGAWEALTRRGWVRLVAWVVAVAALAGAAIALIVRGALDELVILLVVSLVFGWATQKAIRNSRLTRSGAAALPDRTPQSRSTDTAVLLLNPKSGGGKVERFRLVAEAERRGIEPVLLGPDDDLQTLAHEAAGSAAVIGMAGGDGSQALVAQIAMKHGLSYVCVPAGTRNHFALDLGLDRDDVVGALDAFSSGSERPIDLAFVNGRIFVNNVSLGVYAEIVQSDEYRDAKRDTVGKMLPDLLGPRAKPFDLRFAGPDGGEHRSAQMLLVSNNPYVLDSLVGAGSRPRMDTGKLGIVAIEIKDAAGAARLVSLEALHDVRRFEGWTEWAADTFHVDSGSPVAAGIDGEAVVLDPPLRFTITPSALRVRLPPSAVGLSPAALRPGLSVSTLGELWQIAAGRH
jgi:diacylglycerol kinase family enzyme